MNTDTIRRVRFGEINRLSTLIRHTLLVSNSPHYDLQAVKNLSRQYSVRNVRDMALRREMFVHVRDNRITGTVSLKNDTLFSFFVDPDSQRKGIGSRLLDFAEKEAVINGKKVLKVGASITAKGFYLAKGFLMIKQEGDETFGPVFYMEKRLK